ncbi:Arm DNA-binding domain-containing protein [Thioalkalivibrio sp. XN279]|uniref:Arm DNA-binding domain-containing protein n=1 Tax=Thioalkalivibrio sp. XN279 TaxID=2714953 RepID=UPI00140ADBBF|nr:DUF3596 domain-containing protein [Thioalkalivibrio sp. XN279]NHA14631.1 site-specific integrase [Thioalkalivibrio sp. XN279]
MAKKRGVRPASDTSIEIDFMYRGMRCRERINLEPSKANLNHASLMRRRILDEIALGTFEYGAHFPDSPRARSLARNPSSVITVGEALEAYLEDNRTALAYSTWLDYRNSILNQLIPALGHLTLDELKRSHVREFISNKEASPKRLRNILIPLRAVLAELAEDEFIAVDPLAGWQPRFPRRDRELDEDASDVIDPFSLEEIRAIVSAAGPGCRHMLQFGFWTGLRISELIGLRWRDVEDERVSIRMTRVRKRLKDPKTTRSRRIITLLKPAADALREQASLTNRDGTWVFLNPDGGHWLTSDQLRKRAWKPTIEKAGVRYRYPYQMRHTFASMMLTAGENPAWVSTQMGHCDLAMIYKRYGRWIPDNAPKAGALAEARW